MNKSDLAFGKINYIILGVGIVIIVLGFILMSGDGSTEDKFNPAIFSDLRIKTAPLTCLVGFVVVIVAILVKPFGHKNKEVQEEKKEEIAK